jgi:hypothetical protein
MSLAQMPAALTLTTTSPALGTGFGISTISARPASENLMACMTVGSYESRYDGVPVRRS